MPDDNFSAMRQSIIDGAPDTASGLAQQAGSAGIATIDAINNGYVLGMHDVGEQFARGQMYLPDMMASAEAIASAQRLIEGIDARTDSLAVAMFAQTGLMGDFLTLKETRSLFRKEQHFPSAVIDRGLPEMDGPRPDLLQRARQSCGGITLRLRTTSAAAPA
jgi:trimethylamine:corrinoid methyltransferase-like protein